MSIEATKEITGASDLASKLSDNEWEAIDQLVSGPPIAIDEIPTKTSRDHGFCNLIVGLGLWRKLEKKGLVIFTEEEPIDLLDGQPVPEGDDPEGWSFTYTAFLEPTELAYQVRKHRR